MISSAVRWGKDVHISVSAATIDQRSEKILAYQILAKNPMSCMPNCDSNYSCSIRSFQILYAKRQMDKRGRAVIGKVV